MPSTPGVLLYPAALDDLDSLVRVANGANTTLGAAYVAGDPTLTVVDNSLLPASGEVTIGVVGLILTYTAKASTTGLTGVARAASEPNNPADIGVANGSTVSAYITARHHAVLAEGLIAAETKLGSAASAPSNGTVLKGTGVGTSAWSALTPTDITSALAYSPVNKAGDTMTGPLLMSGTTLTITRGSLGASPVQIFGSTATLPNGTGIATTYRPHYILGTITATDIASPGTLIWAGISSAVDIGGAGAAAVVGVAHALTLDTVVKGQGNAGNEYAALYASLEVDIGTGFTQSSGPAGRAWMLDFKLAGPVAVQPGLLQGLSIITNNHYNGNPVAGPSVAALIQTKQGAAVGNAIHTAAATYPLQVGLGIMGVASGGTFRGFETALQIGGTGGGWNILDSRFGYGIDLSGWETAGLYISGKYSGAVGPSIYDKSGGHWKKENTFGQAFIVQANQELVTLNTGGTTTDTVGNLLPANSTILGVDIRINTAIATATAYAVGDASVSNRFIATGNPLTAGTEVVGPSGTMSFQAAAAKVRITTTGTPSAGVMRVVVWYLQRVAPTS